MKMRYLTLLAILLNSAILLPAQTFTSYFTGDTADVQTSPMGGTCLMGGAGEHDEAMKWWLQRADGGDILVIRSSGSDGYNNYLFSGLGLVVNSVETIVFDNDAAAYDPYVIQQLSRAEAVWIAGGDQWNYVRAWRESPIDSVLNLRIAAGAPVGGISAGMAVLGGIYFSAENGTITSAAALANPYDSDATVDTTDFLHAPFLSDVITDTHYDDPPREGRHTAFLAKAYADYTTAVKGIACDEYAAVCIAPDGKAYCYGDAPSYDDFVYFIQPNCELADPAPETCLPGQPLTWNHNGQAMKVLVVNGTNAGTQYMDLTDWKSHAGGTWEEWHADNGVWNKQAGNAINCSVVGSAESEPIGFSLYPNPAKDRMVVELPLGAWANEVVVRDVRGRKVVVPTNMEHGRVVLDVKGLSKGLYSISVAGEGFQWTAKAMVAP